MKTARYTIRLTVFVLLANAGLILSVKLSSTPEHYVLRSNYNSNRIDHSTIGLASTPGNPERHITVKKWQVGRVSRKHYEIVNMLWRKTKIFSDEAQTTPKKAGFKVPRNNPSVERNKKLLSFTAFYPLSQPSTPSYIEFYYLDDNDERIKRRDAILPNTKTEKTQLKFLTNGPGNRKKQYPILSFSADSPGFRFVVAPSQNSNTPDKKQLRRKTFYDKDSMYNFIKNKLKINDVVITKLSNSQRKTKSRESSYDDQTCPVTYESVNNDTSLPSDTNSKNNVTLTSSTKFYDKIKFFEMYDQHTQSPKDEDIFNRDTENIMKENQIDIDGNKKMLEDTHKNIGHDNDLSQKHVKKHIHVDNTEQHSSKHDTNNVFNNPFVKFEKRIVNKTLSYQNSIDQNTIVMKNQKKIFDPYWLTARNASRPALMSDYPFAAVYVYEPSQIHCDAAGLSPHWLVASGACLSRYHYKNPMTRGRSAFVTYCGERWDRPERVAYVKYVIVHPSYHHKDEKRRYLFNIGLIQVVGSMASACIGWRPISIISHNFAANEKGSQVVAVGWGLDRYDRSYFQRDVYKVPLHVYKSLVYSSSCPGHTGYSEMKSKREEAALKNIYCVLLPPYTGEEVDPIHGSMLLVGGNLIALYLQEERRPWGPQSALYTGVWRLLPWVLEVAREPEDADAFEIDM